MDRDYVAIENDIAYTIFVEEDIFGLCEDEVSIVSVEVDLTDILESEQSSSVVCEIDNENVLGVGNQGPAGRDGDGSTYFDVQYSANLVRGQIVYIADDIAYPAVNTSLPAVLNLLAIVLDTGASGLVASVLLQGVFSDNILSLLAGRVFLGDSGFPSSTDNSLANFVPIGHTGGGSEFFFNPRERFVRG